MPSTHWIELIFCVSKAKSMYYGVQHSDYGNLRNIYPPEIFKRQRNIVKNLRASNTERYFLGRGWETNPKNPPNQTPNPKPANPSHLLETLTQG